MDWHDAAWLLVPRLPHFLTYEPGVELYLLCAWLPLAALASRRAQGLLALRAGRPGGAPPAGRGVHGVCEWFRKGGDGRLSGLFLSR